MLNLLDIKNDEHFKILWLPGPAAELKELLSLTFDDPIIMVDNASTDGVIIKKGGKSYAMSGDIASYVRVEKEDFIPA